MKKTPVSKTMPKGEARPLGTPRPKGKTVPTLRRSAALPKIKLVQTSENILPLPEESALQPEPTTVASVQPPIPATKEKTMQLTYKGLNKRKTEAIYTGLAANVRFVLANFPGRVAPDTITIEGDFAPAKEPKRKLTKEERAALPKPTEAEKIAKMEARIAARKAKLAAAQDDTASM